MTLMFQSTMQLGVTVVMYMGEFEVLNFRGHGGGGASTFVSLLVEESPA